jgi:hypothetical protein
MNESLRIQKRVVAATVRAAGQTLKGDLYLGEQAQRHSGTETVLDLLQSEEPFFPLVQKGSGGTALIPISTVDWVSVNNESDAHFSMPGVLEELRGVRVSFGGTPAFSGLLMAVPTPDAPRLLDELNELYIFVPVMVGNQTYVVNARRALWTESVSPKPSAGKKKPVKKKKR